jgi:NAD(P)-dependent dehydrogenase (short-subunit alcohol dehydrogenase family)
MTTERTVLLTGASSGFGLLCSITLARRGWTVLATMRDLERREKLEAAANAAGVIDHIEFHALDVTSPTQISALAGLIEERQLPLHAIVNNAGFAMAGFAEDVSDKELRQQFDTNFFGAAAVTRAFLPRMKRQKFGHIVMVSSVSGRSGFPGISSYVASKFALEGWSETLRLELKPHGVNVVLVEPGAFETDIWTRNAVLSEQTRALAAKPDSEAGARFARWQEKITPQKPRPDPQLFADFLAGILAHPHPRLRYSFGTDAWASICARAVLPWSWFERIIVRSSGIEG